MSTPQFSDGSGTGTGTDGTDSTDHTDTGGTGSDSVRHQEQRARRIEQHFLGSPAELTREQVVEVSGVDLETLRRLWRALGFVDVPEGVPSFGQADLQALAVTTDATLDSVVSTSTRENVARSMGQAMSHLAESQIEAIVEGLTGYPEIVALAERDPDAMLDLLFDLLTPIQESLQDLLLYAWKRHLAAASTRAFASVASTSTAVETAVGFADLVGWTSLTRDMPSADLAVLVEDFESRSFDVVAAAGARVIKVIGDEVMFTGATPEIAVEAGLALAEAFGTGDDPSRPPVRVGIAWGPALARGGDVFGAVVNLASRCTSIARPRTVLADRAMARQLADNPAYVVKRVPPHRVRGYERLEAAAVRRASAPHPDRASSKA